jgi:lipopolysaccharide assembly outer membrane protein LptD (OstA)
MKFALAMMCLVAGQMMAQDAPRVLPQTIDPQNVKKFVPGQGLPATYGFPETIPANMPIRFYPNAARLNPQVSANYILRDREAVTAAGEVELRTSTYIVRADRAVVDTKTGEIQASGNVRIIPIAPATK